MKSIRIATNIVFGAVLLCVLPAAAMQLVRNLSSFSTTTDWRPFAAGLVPGAIVAQATLRWLPQACVLEHELTHASVGLFFGYIPTGIKISRKSGLCTHRILVPWLVPISRPIVTLAPYFLPTITAVMAALRPAIGSSVQPWYDLGIGASLSYHAVTTMKEIRDNGAIREASITDRRFGLLTDFHQAGPVFSWLFVLVATIVTHSLILAVIARGYSGVTEDLQRLVSDTMAVRHHWG